MPGSPAEENLYTRLIDRTTSTATASTTNTTATPLDHTSESGYVCASPISSIENSVGVSAGGVENSDNSSSDDPFFDPDPSDLEQQSPSLSVDYYDCDEQKKEPLAQSPLDLDRTPAATHSIESQCNEHQYNNGVSTTSSSSDSLPKSQSTSLSTFTANTSESNNTIGNDLDMPDFCVSTYANDVDETDHHAIVDDTPKSAPTNSIITNDLLHEIGEVREIPKYESVAKATLSIEPLTNGHACNVTKNSVAIAHDEDDEEEPMPRAERLRRSSSLKTGKTPPGTPGRKKIVRFADVLGLDLADVRTFMDEIPRVPISAYDDLQSTLQAHDVPTSISLGQRCDKVIVPLFQQPCTLPNFLDVVQASNVALENAAVTDPICLTITGLVRVRNLDFHKSVHVRYSLDAWQSFSDLQAQYVENSCDGFSDKFTFTLFGNSMEVGQRIEIALRFSCKGEQFWDNNQGVNYCFQCLPATTTQNTLATLPTNGERHDPNVLDSWCGSSFY